MTDGNLPIRYQPVEEITGGETRRVDLLGPSFSKDNTRNATTFRRNKKK